MLSRSKLTSLNTHLRDFSSCCGNFFHPNTIKIVSPVFIFFLNFFIYLAALGLSCSMWDLAPGPGVEPGPPSLGAQSLSHWTTREVPPFSYNFMY